MIQSQYTKVHTVTNLDLWETVDEETTGVRDKLTLFDQNDARHALIKFPHPDLGHEIWLEVIASFIAGDLLGWNVQRASIGSLGGRLGSLLEYIFDLEPKGEKIRESLIEGRELCREADRTFTTNDHDMHTLDLILGVFHKVISKRYSGISERDYITYWARTFALDALISNRDRHSGNWAIISDGKCSRMAPLYDNGSCLGSIVSESALEKAFESDGSFKEGYFQKFRAKGTHHIRVGLPNGQKNTFEEVCRKFIDLFPGEREHFETAANVDISRVKDLLEAIVSLPDIPIQNALSAKRARFILEILTLGTSRLNCALGLQSLASSQSKIFFE